jgi:hypothetical protein
VPTSDKEKTMYSKCILKEKYFVLSCVLLFDLKQIWESGQSNTTCIQTDAHGLPMAHSLMHQRKRIKKQIPTSKHA